MSWRRSARVLALVAAAVVVVMGGVALARPVLDIPIGVLMNDPAAIVDAPFYLGAVTLLRTGVLAGAAAVCLVTARVLRRRDPRMGEFLLALGLLSAALVVDDKFQVHEVVLDVRLGVPQLVTFAGYAAIALVGAWRYGRLVIGLPEGGVLLMMFPLLALAVLADSLPLFNAFTEMTVELAGIGCLAAFGVRVSLSALLAVAGDDAQDRTLAG